MAVEIKVPEMGESVVEATVARWMKHVGDAVKAGEPVVELETDKVNLEVAAEADGILSQIAHPAGDDVKIGDVLAMIEPSAANGQTTAPAKAAPAKAAKPAAATEEAATPSEQPSPVPVADGQEEPRATPVAKRMAAERGVDLETVPASQPGGRVTKQDVESFLQSQPAAPAKPEPTPAPTTPAPPISTLQSPVSTFRAETRQRMSRRRRTIADRLVQAQQTAAMLTTFNEIDMSAVMDLRKRRNEQFEKRHGIKLGFMSVFVKATIGALKAFPPVNAEIQGDEIVLKHYYDIGIAVGAEEGRVVRVLRAADRLSFAEIEKAIKDLAVKARDGTLSIEDLRGGTFTISNGGIFGSLLSTPILNPPQVGILGMHKIEERPVAVSGQVVIRPMMYVALSYDHRIVDGREAVQFLVKVKELVEDPESLLLEG
ncbi:MAG TPA: 2-oxoglutarate dehydrogenase complex dihydrolipoyllysine-residue succinyltransferase [Caldilineaceae bacterium]|nr:2-oxoglutarate dehydrogenase complex dihydrolipoyllysine-residue succinyltransferase [Caldilineaceae bacterium]